MSRRHDKRTNQVVKALAMIAQFGLNMIVSIGLAVAIGYGIGKWTGAMWVVIPFFFIGVLAGFTSIYKMSVDLFNGADEKHNPAMPMNTNLRSSDRLSNDLDLGMDLGFEQEDLNNDQDQETSTGRSQTQRRPQGSDKEQNKND